MNLARVFPRKTKQSPTDPKAFFGMPDIKTTPYFDAVDISVAFTYDKPKAEALAERWRHHTASVRLGGPAYGLPGGEFEPGKYLKKGITVTSRGCANKCWFCSVHKREPRLKELEIKPGHIIQDDNFLGCSDDHICKVFRMLGEQKERPRFAGGLEAKLLKDWHVQGLKKVKTESMWFAYDTPDDLEPLIQAGRLLKEYGFTFESRKPCCFILMGYPNDTMPAAEERCRQAVRAGFWPQSMRWRNEKGETDPAWQDTVRYWARPRIYAKEALRLYWLDGLI